MLVPPHVVFGLYLSKDSSILLCACYFQQAQTLFSYCTRNIDFGYCACYRM